MGVNFDNLTGAPEDNPMTRRLPSRYAQNVGFLREVWIALVSGLTITEEVFLRKDFGERYLTGPQVTAGALALGGYVAVFGGIDLIRFFTASDATRTFPSQAAWLFSYWLLYVGLACWHLFEIFYRVHYTGVVWHSRSFGVSWLLQGLIGKQPIKALPPLGDWFLYLYAEPFILSVAGLLLILLGLFAPTFFLGVWFFAASIALAAKNQAVYAQEREFALDLSDGRIEAAARRPSAEGAPKEQTAGFSHVALPRAVDADRDGDPDEMQAILDRVMRRGSNASEGKQ